MNFEVCYPESVQGFEPKNHFRTFVVKENAGEEFVAVNNCVNKCCQDIESIITNLKSLKDDMGENTGTTEQIEKVIQGLSTKEDELKQKNRELIQACQEVVDYIYQNKASKSQEAAAVAQTIAGIKI